MSNVSKKKDVDDKNIWYLYYGMFLMTRQIDFIYIMHRKM